MKPGAADAGAHEPSSAIAMNAFLHIHRLLCSPFVDEALYRAALGDGRADLSTVGRYLAIPIIERPRLSLYFDPVYYLARYPDVGEAGKDPLLHFLEYGISERRSPHPLVNLDYIVAHDRLLLGEPATTEALTDVLAFDLAAPSAYFDVTSYQNALGGDLPANGLLGHFLGHGIHHGRNPNPFLDLAWYVRHNIDVPTDPYEALRHFVLTGDLEGRAPGTRFDATLYWARYPDVATAKAAPLLHFLDVGRSEGRQAGAEGQASGLLPEVGQPVPIDIAAINAADAGLRTILAARRQVQKDAVRATQPAMLAMADAATEIARLRFPIVAQPRVSILIPVYNEPDITIECLMAIAEWGVAADYEVVIADDASDDPLIAGLGEIPGLVHARQATNVGFVANCNAGFAVCRGAYVLLLNNDTQVQPDAIDRMVRALDGDVTLGAVGPKLIYPNGRLQEAGCFLRPNGESGMVGLFRDPEEPGFCYDRDVAYCSGAALMLRKSALDGPLFDDAFRPAYCEDADLCLRLRSAGHRVRYLHQAVVVHHLSVSTNRGSVARKLRGISRNQQTLVSRWGERLAADDAVRVLAFYLPQFHPTPENDLWWGPGFTEWRNVTKAQPSYQGHYQPHLPTDLGFYDLRAPQALAAQAGLAARYGIDGFCVYYYNFGTRRVLSQPIEVVRANPEIPFRWCICWANENWTRHWDGGSKEILLEQQYDAATLGSIIADAVSQAADPRYITVSGKPLFLIYRPLLLPDVKAFAAEARAAFAAAGFTGVHLVYVESMEAVDHGLCPADIGFDASVEFPPHGRAVPARDSVDVVKEGWTGYRYDYPETASAFITRPTVPYSRFPAVFPGWDNTARQRLRGTSFDNATPQAFGVYVEEKLDEIRDFLLGDEKLLFVNAWNEWAEGTHLEPDTGYGHRWLEALRDARASRSWD